MLIFSSRAGASVWELLALLTIQSGPQHMVLTSSASWSWSSHSTWSCSQWYYHDYHWQSSSSSSSDLLVLKFSHDRFLIKGLPGPAVQHSSISRQHHLSSLVLSTFVSLFSQISFAQISYLINSCGQIWPLFKKHQTNNSGLLCDEFSFGQWLLGNFDFNHHNSCN